MRKACPSAACEGCILDEKLTCRRAGRAVIGGNGFTRNDTLGFGRLAFIVLLPLVQTSQQVFLSGSVVGVTGKTTECHLRHILGCALLAAADSQPALLSAHQLQLDVRGMGVYHTHGRSVPRCELLPVCVALKTSSFQASVCHRTTFHGLKCHQEGRQQTVSPECHSSKSSGSRSLMFSLVYN